VSANEVHRGDLAGALGAIRARTVIMPGRTDLYFTPEDCAAEAALIPGAELRVIESVYGHRAGNPTHCPEDEAVLRETVRGLLEAGA
jgi:homoserine O-acetyltransferase